MFLNSDYYIKIKFRKTLSNDLDCLNKKAEQFLFGF